MTRIIPPELNKKIKREYILRFFSILFLLISFVMLINISLVSSSYLLLYLYEKAYVQNPASSESEGALKMRGEINEKIEGLYYLANSYIKKDEVDQLMVSSKIFELAGDSVAILAIEINDKDIVLRGLAKNRDELLIFQNKMKEQAIFEDFERPIEMLAKQKDISFNVNFSYVKN